MEHITVGRKHNEGKIALVKCIKDGSLDSIDIKGECFLLIVLTKGRLDFTVGAQSFSACAPSFLCFNEQEAPVFTSNANAEYTCIYFHPKFLNINMTFELVYSKDYPDIATAHDMFMLKPFIDKVHIVQMSESQTAMIENCTEHMIEELEDPHDLYWSCRCRSYFMEMLIALERMYGFINYELGELMNNGTRIPNDPKLRDAIFYIEGNYGENITLSDISSNIGVNHTTLTVLMKKELGCTAMEYLMRYRVSVSEKQLAFTDVPIKEIANMVGFKTVQHFNRVFKEHTGTTPAKFRHDAVERRRKEI